MLPATISIYRVRYYLHREHGENSVLESVRTLQAIDAVTQQAIPEWDSPIYEWAGCEQYDEKMQMWVTWCDHGNLIFHRPEFGNQRLSRIVATSTMGYSVGDMSRMLQADFQ